MKRIRLIGMAALLGVGLLCVPATVPGQDKDDKVTCRIIYVPTPESVVDKMLDMAKVKRTDVVYGRGVLNVPEVLRALREVKFQGTISIEYEANPNNPSPDMQACIDVFKESVRKLG